MWGKLVGETAVQKPSPFALLGVQVSLGSRSGANCRRCQLFFILVDDKTKLPQ